ncbi:unnamed protein product [Linum trigynum]|uniref:Uncharacterized protein n=1 Tax=Linum trigynum TaxID=586398 RepID=A0AAV2EM40_9ROSI
MEPATLPLDPLVPDPSSKSTSSSSRAGFSSPIAADKETLRSSCESALYFFFFFALPPSQQWTKPLNRFPHRADVSFPSPVIVLVEALTGAAG